jgi:opacity protein-like surface antigen
MSFRLAALATACMASIAHANPLSDVVGGTTTYYAQTEATYSVGGVDQVFTHSRLGLDYSEMGNSWLYGGITVGIVFLDAATEPLIADESIPGYMFGVFGGVQKRFFSDKLAINAEARYLREWMSGDIGATTDNTSVKFGESSLRLGLSYRFEDVQFSAGGYSSNVSGDINRTGAVPGSATFEDTETSGAYAGVDVKLYGGFAVGLRAESGARETAALTFSTGF